MFLKRGFAVSLVFVFVTVFAFDFPGISFASGNENTVLVLYSKTNEEQMKDIRILETMVGQFKNDYKMMEDEEADQANLNDYEYVIYLGAGKKTLSHHMKSAIDDYKGAFYAIGHNAEQFKERLPWLDVRGEALVNQVALPKNDLVQDLSEDRIVYEVSADDAEVSGFGYKADGSGSLPLVVNAEDDYYFSGQNLYNPFGEVVTESFRLFLNDGSKGTVKYLRLEDVHPMADPELLREQAEYLKKENIPYMVAVIPVYENKDKIVHLSDSPKLVDTLRYMQENGASIIMHGYKHQYRSSETGEGFEFWDAENDRPIYQPAKDKAKQRSDFSTAEEYDEFVKKGEKYEKGYMENAIRSGVEELVAHDLYPIAFEAPHYAISQQGYRIVSKHFSSYVGQLQLTDSTWQSEYAPMHESKPDFLHGMIIYPETLGYIEQGDAKAMEKLNAKIETGSKYSQSYLSAFYHPYLGLDGLKEVVKSLNEVNGDWLDLKQKDNLVQVKDIRIQTKDGEYQVEKPFLASDYERNLFIKKSLIWAIPLVLFILPAASLLVIRRRE